MNTLQSMRRAADQLPRLQTSITSTAVEVRKTSAEVRQAAQVGTIAFVLVAIVAVLALVLSAITISHVRRLPI